MVVAPLPLHPQLEKPAVKHFNSNGHSLEDLSVFVTEKIYREETKFYNSLIADPGGTQSQSIDPHHLNEQWSLRRNNSI